ncbi:MAG: hypothetical protein Q8S09_10695, partial [Hyphomonas sp.]|nr:hypothetical protein [Hyphomonas sp.]
YVTGDAAEYLANLRSVWRDTGVCPAPSFYVASPTGNKFVNSRHYLIHSRNVFVELEAEGYSWREWEWKLPERDDNISEFDPVASGEGFE